MTLSNLSKAILVAGGSCGALALALLSPSAAFAQDMQDMSAETAMAEDDASEPEIVVTGSRIQTNFQAPTPVTVATAEELTASAPGNLADGLNQLPVFADGNKTGSGGATSVSGGQMGQNLLNLRGLGANRTLILLDGHRMVATNQNGSVDVNIIPQSLVRRVDVVTGGASAAYGSDAVAGVVNFVLDMDFDGVKGDVGTGISTYGDLGSVKGSLAFGKGFADGRGRFIAAAEYFRQKGVADPYATDREWWYRPAGRIPNPNPSTGTPFLVVEDLRASSGSNGGLITSGPLRGIEFLPGGGTRMFDFGTITSTTWQSGGDGPLGVGGFSPDQRRWNMFARGEFDVTDNFTVFAEGLYAKTNTLNGGAANQHVGSSARFTIFRNNAFLPDSVRQRMVDLNLQSIQVGRYFNDAPWATVKAHAAVTRYSVGFEGKIGSSWSYDASYTYGQTKQYLGQQNRTNMRNIYAAVDAVVDPVSGNIVCRSTLNGLDPGCVPLNIFGHGSVTEQALDFIYGTSEKDMKLTQKVAVLNIAGDLGETLQLGAGPIAVAAGLEYRHEGVVQTSDAVSQSILNFDGLRGFPTALNNRIGVYQSYNPQPLSGSYNIKEAYLEVGVPVFKDKAFAQSLDVNGAVRRADYSLAGPVTTWKYGFNWLVIDPIRIRYTKSRDIRGPNSVELFNAQFQQTGNFIYNGQQLQSFIITSGNPNLKPEKALTETYGIVLRPSFIPGLQLSADRYKIKLKDAIGVLDNTDIVRLCEQDGRELACAQYEVLPDGAGVRFRKPTMNLDVASASGYDFEVAYDRPVADGKLQLRLLATHITKSETLGFGASAPVVELGTPEVPRWRATATVRFSKDNWSVQWRQRYIHKSVVEPDFVEGVDINHNNLPAVTYSDINAQYSFGGFGGEHELYFSVTNLFDKDPPFGSNGPPGSFLIPASAAYDWAGRYFNVGFRFKF